MHAGIDVLETEAAVGLRRRRGRVSFGIRSVLYSVICASAVGYVFGVVFAIRAIGMSSLQDSFTDMLIINGIVGLTFAAMFAPVGVAALALLTVVRTLFGGGRSRRARIYFLAWMVLGTCIAVPFLGYYYSSGVNPHDFPGTDSPWDLVPVWLFRIGRWVGFSMLTASVTAFVAAETMVWYFRIHDDLDIPVPLRRLLLGVPIIVLLTWLLPPVCFWVAGRTDSQYGATAVQRLSSEEVEQPIAPVIVIGWDGATWDVIDPLLDKGALPNLAALIERGTRAPLASFEPTSSPLIWTTISTGRPPGQHGVRSQVENRFVEMNRWFFFPPSMGFDHIFGRVWEEIGLIERVQITSHARSAKAFWNILDEAGRSVGLVNWRVAWPAEHFRGFNITDHTHPFLVRLLDDGTRIDPTLSPAVVLENMPGAVFPGVEPSALEGALRRARDRTRVMCDATGLPPELAPEEEVFGIELAHDMISNVGWPDVLGVYFYEVDGIEHRYWKYREPGYFFGVSNEDIARYGNAIDQMYEFYDTMLGVVLDSAPEDALVMLLSDHGHGPVFGELTRSGGHSHAPPGILVMAGPGVLRSANVEQATVYDIFPTLMYVSGVPTERTARGRVLLEAFDPAIIAERPVREIERYGPREEKTRTRTRTSPVDHELINRLRGLGYVG